MKQKEIPYKIYLEESEMPKEWYNVRADMKNKPAPLLNPQTLQPMTAEELGAVFCDELVAAGIKRDRSVYRDSGRDPQLLQDVSPFTVSTGLLFRRKT